MTSEARGKVYQGDLDGTGKRFAVVVSRFNEFITSRLLAGAQDCLQRHGVAPASIDVVWVPGAWELPLAVWRLARSRQYDGLLALGCVIQGATAHAPEINAFVARSLGECALATDVPVAHGVITPHDLEQAVERAGMKGGNRGADAALAVLEMVSLLGRLPAGKQE